MNIGNERNEPVSSAAIQIPIHLDLGIVQIPSHNTGLHLQIHGNVIVEQCDLEAENDMGIRVNRTIGRQSWDEQNKRSPSQRYSGLTATMTGTDGCTPLSSTAFDRGIAAAKAARAKKSKQKSKAQDKSC